MISCNVIIFYIIPGPPKRLNYHKEGNLKPGRYECIISIFLHVQETNFPRNEGALSALSGGTVCWSGRC